MNKKILLGVGSLAAATLPVSVVVACNDKDDANNTSATTKTASVTPAAIANVAASVAGSENAHTLAVVKTDTVTKTELEAALKRMVAKADGDTETPTFAGTWDTDFDGTKNATYTYTVKATGYTDVTFAVTVTGNTMVTKTAVVKPATITKVAATVTGTNNAHALAVVKTDTVTKTELEAALKRMVAKADGDTETPTFAGTWDTDFDGTKNATYTYTVKATGYTDVTFAVTVTGNTMVTKTAVVTPTSPSKVAATVTGTNNAHTLAVVKTDTITKTELETALKGMVKKADGDTATPTFAGTWDTDFDGTKNATYTYTVKATGYTDVTFAVTVTGNTMVTKTAVVKPATITKVAATVTGTNNAHALAVVKTDTVTKTELEAALKRMVAKADGDTETPTFAGTWDTDFDGTKNATYTYTVKATGYTDVTFAVTVTGNTMVTKTAVVTPTSPSKVAATVTGTNNAHALAVVKTDTVTKTELEAALKRMVAKADGDTETPTFAGTWDTDFDGTKNATYTYTVKATGYKDVTFAVTVSGN